MSDLKRNKKILEKNFVYYPEMEHEACGVGLIASTNGKKSRKIVDCLDSYGIIITHEFCNQEDMAS